MGKVKKEGSPEQCFNTGLVYARQGKHANAQQQFEEATQLNPKYAQAWANLGVVLKAQGKNKAALAAYQKALALKPDFVDVLFNLGNYYRDTNEPGLAAGYYKKVLRLNPLYAQAYFNLGGLFKRANKPGDAIQCFQKALQIVPKHVDACLQLALTFESQRHHKEALRTYQQALKIMPNSGEIYNNVGNVFKNMGKLKDAGKAYVKATELSPRLPEAYSNLGVTLQLLGQHEAVMPCYKKALEINPEHISTRTNRALTHLLHGRYTKAWPDYEYRFQDKGMVLPQFSKPRWDGSSLKNKTIFVYAEQGLGDTIQFVRYLPLLKEQGATVIFQCQPELESLLKDFSGIDTLIASNALKELELDYDFHAPLLSLPGLTETTVETIPADLPYIYAQKDKVEEWASWFKPDKINVGFVWAGNETHKADWNRSCQLRQFDPIFKNTFIEFYSLQKGLQGDKYPPSPQDLGHHIKDFSDTAAIMEHLDLVVTVDTSVAHLAGAMGKPVWIALSYVPDWRWMLDREDSPWYPSIRLFRQPRFGDWQSVFQTMANELKCFQK